MELVSRHGDASSSDRRDEVTNTRARRLLAVEPSATIRTLVFLRIEVIAHGVRSSGPDIVERPGAAEAREAAGCVLDDKLAVDWCRGPGLGAFEAERQRSSATINDAGASQRPSSTCNGATAPG